YYILHGTYPAREEGSEEAGSRPWFGHRAGRSIVRVAAKVEALDSHRWTKWQDAWENGRPAWDLPIPTVRRGWHAHYINTGAGVASLPTAHEESGQISKNTAGQWARQYPRVIHRPVLGKLLGELAGPRKGL